MGFDVERYLTVSRRVETEDLDWDAVPNHPLRPEEQAFLAYAMNIEDHTLFYLKDLLETPAATEPDVAAFLSCWVYEEHFHGRALERFAQAHAGDGAPKRDAVARQAQQGRFAKWVKKTGTRVISRMSPDFAAVHMTWGAVNELTTLSGYEQLARRTEHPVLRELLGRIIKDERRHFAFYYNQADMRLAKSPRQQRITRWLMDRIWRPVGSGEFPLPDVVASGAYVFGSKEGRETVSELEATIGQLPGMAGWNRLSTRLGLA